MTVLSSHLSISPISTRSIPIRTASFSRKKGRPRKSPSPSRDYGTQEFQRHYQAGHTQDILDRLLHSQQLTEAQHRTARRFAWLHRLRYGKSWVSARTLSPIVYGTNHPSHHHTPALCTSRQEADLKQALLLLRQHQLEELVVHYTVLAPAIPQLSPDASSHIPAQHLPLLQRALQLLVQQWHPDSTYRCTPVR